MFARVATIFTFLFFILPFLAAATAVPRGGGGSGGGSPPPASQCNTGDLQCCKLSQWISAYDERLISFVGNSVQSSDSSGVNILAALLGIVLGPVEGLVGLTCNPISAIGVGGNSWSVTRNSH